MANKTERFAVRLTAEQDALIRQAAEVEGLRHRAAASQTSLPFSAFSPHY